MLVRETKRQQSEHLQPSRIPKQITTKTTKTTMFQPSPIVLACARILWQALTHYVERLKWFGSMAMSSLGHGQNFFRRNLGDPLRTMPVWRLQIFQLMPGCVTCFMHTKLATSQLKSYLMCQGSRHPRAVAQQQPSDNLISIYVLGTFIAKAMFHTIRHWWQSVPPSGNCLVMVPKHLHESLRPCQDGAGYTTQFQQGTGTV